MCSLSQSQALGLYNKFLEKFGDDEERPINDVAFTKFLIEYGYRKEKAMEMSAWVAKMMGAVLDKLCPPTPHESEGDSERLRND